MGNLSVRLAKLENAIGGGRGPVVLWSIDQDFDEALDRAPTKDMDGERLLIELTFLGTDREALTPEQEANRTKAYAWADGEYR